MQEIKIVISALDKATQGIQKVSNNLKSFAEKNEKTFKKMSTIGGVAFGAITATALTTVKAFAESEAQLTRVDQILRNIDLTEMNTGFDEAAKKSRDFGSSLQSLSGISDEAGAESFAKLLQITNDYTEAQKLATLAADLSIAKQIDLDTATKSIAMAMAGNTRVLKEFGIEVSDNATKQEVLGALMDRVGGQATAYGKTLQGQSDILKQSFGDMQESIGQAFAPIINKILPVITDLIVKFGKWASENTKLVSVILAVGTALTGLITTLGLVGLAIGPVTTAFAALSGPIGWVTIAVIALSTAFATDFLGIRTITVEVFTSITEFINGTAEMFQNFGASILPFFSNAWSSTMDFIGGLTQRIVDNILEKFNALKNTIQSVINFAKSAYDSVKNIGASIKSAASAVGNAVTGQRALGGPVQANRTYLVGENGPELFTPRQTGFINNNPKSGTSVNINMGGVVVNNEADENRLVEKLRNALIRDTKLYNLGVY